MNIAPACIAHDGAHGLQQEIDSFLLTDDADIADEMSASALQLGSGGRRLHAREVGTERTTKISVGATLPRSMAMRR